jgi:DNA-binding NarL/FixJ family response regulator
MMRDGLGALLAQDADLEVVGTASDGRSAVEQVRALTPDVVVMDIGCTPTSATCSTCWTQARWDTS